MARTGFDTYFEERARRFSSFYRSEPVARLLGRGALFDRLRLAVDAVAALGATRVLDVGCGSGPLFSPLAERGVSVTGIDPAPAMVELAKREAARYPSLVHVRQERWEDLEDIDSYDAAVALGVFDYVADPVELLLRMRGAAPNLIASFPVPGLRLRLRRLRYGARGVEVHGYTTGDLERLAQASQLELREFTRLGRAGHLAKFARPGG